MFRPPNEKELKKKNKDRNYEETPVIPKSEFMTQKELEIMIGKNLMI